MPFSTVSRFESSVQKKARGESKTDFQKNFSEFFENLKDNIWKKKMRVKISKTDFSKNQIF